MIIVPIKAVLMIIMNKTRIVAMQIMKIVLIKMAMWTREREINMLLIMEITKTMPMIEMMVRMMLLG